MKCKLFLAVLLFVSTGVFAQNVSLDQAVLSSAQTIDSRLPRGAKTAVLTFTSASQAFSDYIIDEIATALSASRNIQVIDRQHTAAIRKEFNIQFSGDVSDAEVKRAGQQLGAQYVVTGSLVDIGNAYRFRVAAINIETAVREGASSLNINIDDPQVVFFLTGRRPGQPDGTPMRRIAGNVPDFVRQAVAAVPADSLIGIGTAKLATLSYSRSVATTRARAEISRQMITMVREMVRDYTASSEIDSATVRSFEFNITGILSQSRLQGATVIAEDMDANGSYWVEVQLTKTNVAAEINQAAAAAKLAVPAMLSFNQDRMMNAAIERAYRAEIGYSDSDKPMRRIAGNLPDFVRQAVAANVPYDALVGIGTAKQATLNLSRASASTRARAEISRQMNAMMREMVREYMASSEVDQSASVSFTENITTALSQSNLQGATVIAEDVDANGNYWVVVQLSKANVAALINQAQATAKLAVPAMLSFDAERMMNVAIEKACQAEIGYSDR